MQIVLERLRKCVIKLFNTCTFVCDFVPNRYMTQEMCDKVVSEEPFMLRYCVDRYKTQEICDIAVIFIWQQ